MNANIMLNLFISCVDILQFNKISIYLFRENLQQVRHTMTYGGEKKILALRISHDFFGLHRLSVVIRLKF